MTIVIGQWAYLSVPLEGPGRTIRFKERWMPPAGNGPRLDLRPLPAQASSAKTPQGFGLFVVDGPAPPGTFDLGQSLLQPLSTDQRRGFESRLNLANGDLDAPSLGDAIWRVMTVHADPTGDNQIPPIMPKHDGKMRLRIGGATKEEQYDPVKHPKVITRARDDAAANSRTLDALARKLGVSKTELSVPSGGATYGDTFVEASDTAIGSHTPTGANAGSGWTAVNGSWRVGSANNTGEQTTVTDPGSARMDDDLSGDDMLVYVNVYAIADFRAGGPLARFASAAETYYGYSRDVSNSLSQELFKVVTGTVTSLSSTGSDYPDPSTPYELRLSVDGSDLEALEASVSKESVTDTSITGNTRGGIYSDEAVGNAGIQFQDFVMEDIGGGPAAVVIRRNLTLMGVGR